MKVLQQNAERYYTYTMVRTLDEVLVEDAKQNFARYKQEGVLIGCAFEDDVWKLTDEVETYGLDFHKIQDPYRFVIENKLELSAEDFVFAIKVYCMMLLGIRDLDYIRMMLVSLRKVFDGLIAKDRPEVVLSALQDDYLMPQREFWSLLQTENETICRIQQWMERYKPKAEVTQQQRELSPMTSYFRFSEVMEQFWMHAGKQDKLDYFPLWFWWNISVVLPMRPTEIILTPRDCIQRNENGTFQLTIRKDKLKGGQELHGYCIEADYERHTYTIPQEIGQEIVWYIQNTESYAENQNCLLFRHPKRDSYRYDDLRKLLHRFYDVVVPNYFDVVEAAKNEIADNEICRIQLGDTRHIAMISLILQGSSPTVCRDLAGHRNVDISAHYYNNISKLVDSVTYELVRKKKETQQVEAHIPQVRPLYGMQYAEIAGGRCYSRAFSKDGSVDDCIANWEDGGEMGDCKNCRYFRSTDRSFQLLDLKQENKETLDEQFQYIQKMIQWVRGNRIPLEALDREMQKLNGQITAYTQLLEQEEQNGTQEEI